MTASSAAPPLPLPEGREVSGFSGAYTTADGRRVQMTPEEAERIWRETHAYQAERAARLPDEKAALHAMFDAHARLKELGWSEAIYCPKDGSFFDVIEAGSTGIFRCNYQGEWPTGSWWIDQDGGTPSRPTLFRLYPEDEAKRQERIAQFRRDHPDFSTPPSRPSAGGGDE